MVEIRLFKGPLRAYIQNRDTGDSVLINDITIADYPKKSIIRIDLSKNMIRSYENNYLDMQRMIEEDFENFEYLQISNRTVIKEFLRRDFSELTLQFIINRGFNYVITIKCNVEYKDLNLVLSKKI